MGNDGFAQIGQPVRVGIVADGADVLGAAGGDARPAGQREGVKRRNARLECIAEPARRRRHGAQGACEVAAAAGERRRRGVFRRGVLRIGGEQHVGRDRGDTGAGADTGLQIALGDQLVIGVGHRVAADAEFSGKGAGGGQAGARRGAACENARAQGLGQLRVQGQIGGPVQRQTGQGGEDVFHHDACPHQMQQWLRRQFYAGAAYWLRSFGIIGAHCQAILDLLHGCYSRREPCQS